MPHLPRFLLATAPLVACSLLIAACGGDSGTTTSTGAGAQTTGQQQAQAGVSTAPQSANGTRPPAPDDAIHDKPGGAGSGGSGPSAGGGTRHPSAADRTRIERTVKAYIAALDADDGAALCRLFAPGALKGVKLPVHRGTCAATLKASVGHPPRHGAPRWLGTKLLDADRVVVVRGGDGRFTGTVVHKQAGSEPSIEDDVVFLRKQDGRWLLVKPSLSFYRAIGEENVPVTVLSPPK